MFDSKFLRDQKVLKNRSILKKIVKDNQGRTSVIINNSRSRDHNLYSKNNDVLAISEVPYNNSSYSIDVPISNPQSVIQS